MSGHTFRPRSAIATAAMIWAAGALLALPVLIGGPAWSPFAFAAVGLAGVGGQARLRVVASDTGVTVHNPLRTHRVAWADIEGFGVDRYLVVRRRDGSWLSCLGFPRSLGAALLGRRERAEEIAAELERLRPAG